MLTAAAELGCPIETASTAALRLDRLHGIVRIVVYSTHRQQHTIRVRTACLSIHAMKMRS
jgi:hypothetical protein